MQELNVTNYSCEVKLLLHSSQQELLVVLASVYRGLNQSIFP